MKRCTARAPILDRGMRVAATLLAAAALAGCSARGPMRAWPTYRTGAPSGKRFAVALMTEVLELASTMRTAETCADVCRITTRICEAADKICEIAAAEPADRDLSERCGHARTHCMVARDRCQRCT